MKITTKKMQQRSGSLRPFVRELISLVKKKSMKLLNYRRARR